MEGLKIFLAFLWGLALGGVNVWLLWRSFQGLGPQTRQEKGAGRANSPLRLLILTVGLWAAIRWGGLWGLLAASAGLLGVLFGTLGVWARRLQGAKEAGSAALGGGPSPPGESVTPRGVTDTQDKLGLAGEGGDNNAR